MKKRKNKPAKNRGQSIVVRPPATPSATDVQAMMSPEYVKQRRDSIMELMRLVMQDGVHYGRIEGCGDKPALYQPGAQALCQLFNCGPRFEVMVKEEERGHRTVTVTCKLVNNATGAVVGEGRGVCTTLEKKYRWRQGGRVCPICGAAAIKPSQFRPEFYCHEKVGGCNAKFEETDERITSQKPGRVENEDLADSYNTVEKIACKRAMVHATLNITGASELFTQDIEDMRPDRDEEERRPTPPAGQQQVKRTTTAPAAGKVVDEQPPASKPAPRTWEGHVLAKLTQDNEAAVKVMAVELANQSKPGDRVPWKLFAIIIQREGRYTEVLTDNGPMADAALMCKASTTPALVRWKIDNAGRAMLTYCAAVAPVKSAGGQAQNRVVVPADSRGDFDGNDGRPDAW